MHTVTKPEVPCGITHYLFFFFFFSVIFCTHFLIFLPNSVAGASTMKAGEARSVKRGDASLLGQLM